MTKHSSALLSKLKSSLPKTSVAAPVSIPTEPKPKSAAAERPVRGGKPKLARGGEGHAAKISVSLYSRDLGRLDEIKEFMRGQGFRNLSDSEALRLACRAASLGQPLLDLYRDMREEDCRRKPAGK